MHGTTAASAPGRRRALLHQRGVAVAAALRTLRRLGIAVASAPEKARRYSVAVNLLVLYGHVLSLHLLSTGSSSALGIAAVSDGIHDPHPLHPRRSESQLVHRPAYFTEQVEIVMIFYRFVSKSIGGTPDLAPPDLRPPNVLPTRTISKRASPKITIIVCNIITLWEFQLELCG
jgi:hypothetical protein